MNLKNYKYGEKSVELKGRTVNHNKDGSTTVFYDNGDIVEWGKPKITDLEKLKAVLDDIGVSYEEEAQFLESNEMTIPVRKFETSRNLIVNNGCFECCGIQFEFKGGKFYSTIQRY